MKKVIWIMLHKILRSKSMKKEMIMKEEDLKMHYFMHVLTMSNIKINFLQKLNLQQVPELEKVIW